MVAITLSDEIDYGSNKLNEEILLDSENRFWASACLRDLIGEFWSRDDVKQEADDNQFYRSFVTN